MDEKDRNQKPIDDERYQFLLPPRWEKEIKNEYNTLCVFEDSNKCVDMWRDLGILTCQVANGDY